MRDNLKFIGKVTGTHIITYIVCGMIFSSLFNYEALFSLGNARYFMREFSGSSTLIGPVVQVFRGLLFGLILLLFRDVFVGKKYGWLKLWAVLVVVGIVNTPAPAPFSIEGIIYTQLPLEFHLKGAPEILVQTLLFSYIVARDKSKRRVIISDKYKTAFIAMIIAAVSFSLSGIILALITGIDVMAGTKDVLALVIMLIAAITVFLMTQWYIRSKAKYKTSIYFIICYAAMAVLPTVYNFITNSPFKSYLSLIINLVPVVIIVIFSRVYSKD